MSKDTKGVTRSRKEHDMTDNTIVKKKTKKPKKKKRTNKKLHSKTKD
jgi:hypothetical protein